MSWFFREARLNVLAIVIVLAADVPALVRGVPMWLEVLLAITTVAALTRAFILWRSQT